jgi:protein tyrosine/serine phosphatase
VSDNNPVGRKTVPRITLKEPPEGALTQPLQVHPLPVERGQLLAGAGEGEGAARWYGVSSVDDDRSRPVAVRFLWSDMPPVGIPVRYELEVRAADASGETTVLRDLTAPWAEVENLRVGADYRWRVRAFAADVLVGQSNEGAFRTHPALPRWIHAPGITNVRDLGGWPLPEGRRVRQGRIFRGSEMNSHCQITPEGQRVLVEQLGIRTDIDLRGPGEERSPALDSDRVRYVNIPLSSYDMIASPDDTVRYRALFHLLAEEETYPVFIHCWGGADRTGTVAFLIGAMLGMYAEDLYADYELTSLSIWGERRSDGEPFVEMLQLLQLFAPQGATLQAQVERYLRVIGVTGEAVAKIRSHLIE